jgi:hypothetical protein
MEHPKILFNGISREEQSKAGVHKYQTHSRPGNLIAPNTFSIITAVLSLQT